MHDIGIYYLNTNNFDIQKAETYLSQYSNLNIDKTIRTYKEKLLSQFIRHFVFKEMLGVTNPSFTYDDSGKPYLNNSIYQFSISHTQGKVVMAVCMDEIGVDVESIRPRKNILGIAERFFTVDEYNVLRKSKELYRDFFTLWTLKESQVKKTSDGIAKGLMTATFNFDENGWKTSGDKYLFETFYLGDHVLSICISNSEIHSPVSILEILANLQINTVNI